MFLLQFYQQNWQKEVAVFATLEEGQAFVHQIPSYQREEADGFVQESFQPNVLPDYMEVTYHGHRFPLSRFSFPEDRPVEIDWQELPYLSEEGQGLVTGESRVDAYAVDHEDMETYIREREAAYQEVKVFLEQKGYQVDRHFFGSEDGEAIVYRKENQDWHFLTHLDPMFVAERLEGVDLNNLL